MYNVEEAYLHTAKYGSQTYKKLQDYVDQSIVKQTTKGIFNIILNLEQKDYPVEDINRLVKYLIFLGYNVFCTELTNEVTQLQISWTDKDAKDYLDKNEN
jgi:hypothetical protein